MKVRMTAVYAAVLLAILMVTQFSARAAADKAEAAIVAQLPKFCWQQYMDGVSGPGYFIDPKDCGWGMNHYCQGLVEFLRAKRTFGNQNLRLHHLQVAKQDTVYTINAMKNYPSCSIRGHVESTLAQINGYLKGMGQK